MRASLFLKKTFNFIICSYSLVAMHRLLIAVASVLVVHRLSCHLARGIVPDQR